MSELAADKRKGDRTETMEGLKRFLESPPEGKTPKAKRSGKNVRRHEEVLGQKGDAKNDAIHFTV